jgi:nucleoside 2-deoxyribosyltransferase
MSLVYIASPFFNEKQLNFVKEIEKILDKAEMPYFSPRKHGILQDLSASEKARAKAHTFALNVANLDLCSQMVAVVDGRDTGTVWEMGYAFATDVEIVSISNEGHGINVMLAESVKAHITDLSELKKALTWKCYTGETVDDVY